MRWKKPGLMLSVAQKSRSDFSRSFHARFITPSSSPVRVTPMMIRSFHRRLVCLLTLGTLSLGLLGCSTTSHRAAHATTFIQRVSLPSSSVPITAAMEREQREKFSQWLEERSPRFYFMVGQRLFTVKLEQFYWKNLTDEIGAAVKKSWPTAVEDTSWRQPDYFAVRGWRIPERPGVSVVVAALGELPETGAYLVGLYEIDEPRPVTLSGASL
jgi:hypothetical protein